MIAFPNRAQSAAINSGGFSGVGSFQANFPAQNLALPQLALPARSTNTTTGSTQFVVDLGSSQTIRLAAVIGHNATLNVATVDVNGTNDASLATWLYLSGVLPVWPISYAAEEVAGYVWTFVHILPSPISARYWLIRFTDTGNAAGFFQAAQVFLGPVWQPSHGMAGGASLALTDPTQVETGLGGADYFDERSAYRTARFRLEFLDRNEQLGQGFEIMRRAKTLNDVFIVMDPADTTNMIRQAFIGRLRELSPIEYPYCNWNHSAWEIKEKVA